MLCIICGNPIGATFPVPIAEIRFTPIVPTIPGITENKLGLTILTDRLCCQDCYKKIKENDQLIVEEASRIPKDAH